MKSLFVCCLAVLAVTASNLPRPFQGQENYVFRFDTQISSSLIGSSPSEIQQAAATRLRADVRLSFTNDRHANMALSHIRMGELNADLPKSQRVQPLEHFERKEIPVEVKQQLEYPLSVSIVDGVVERINFAENDATWSKNIKRAVLNMIQLNLKKNDVQKLKMQSSMPFNEGDNETPVFSIPEITLEGQCEAVYTIQKSNRYGDEDENTQFNVTKTIDFGKCLKTADVSYGYQQANPAEQLRCLKCLRQQSRQQDDLQEREQARLGHCQQECQPNKINEDKDVERSTFARFELVGKQEKYAIRRSSMISQYVVKAQNPASQNTLIQVVALSELTFKEQDSQQKVQSFKQSSTDETLMFSPEYDVQEKRFYMQGDELESPFAKVQKKQQKASHAMRQILRQWADKTQGYELDAALNFNRLTQVLRESTVSEIKEIEQLVHQLGQDETQSQQHSQELTKTIFFDALASAATRNTLQVLSEKIMKSEIKSLKAAQLIKSFVNNQHSPSEAQADILKKIAMHEVAHRSGPLKQTAWLAYGEAIGNLCQDKPAQSQNSWFRVEELCTKGKKAEFKKTLLQQFKTAETIYEKVLVLKSIGNAALDNMVEELGRIIKDKQQPTLVRMEGIDALRRLRTSMPEKIQQILMPIFQNQRQEPEIRMAAFSMIVYTQPEKAILDQLAFSVIHDRSQNVKTFVLTALESLAKSPSSAEQQVATHMKAALKMIQLNPEQMRSSIKYRVPIYISEQEDTEEQNIFLALTSIVSPSNMLPIHLAASIQSAIDGTATNKNLEILVSQKNLESWYEKIAEYAEQYGQSSDEDKENMERRSAKDLRQIYSSLGIKNRRQGSYYLSSSEESDEQQPGKQPKTAGDNQPFGMIVIRNNDVDKYIVPVSEEQLPQIVKQMLKGEKPSLMSQLDELSQRLTTGQQQFRQHIGLSTGDKKTRIPTTSGLPLSLERKVSAVASVEGELKVRVESENLESSRGLTAELKLRTSGIATHLHRAKVWSPVLVSGVETVRTIEMNGPLDIKVRADRQKVEIKMNLPTEHKIRLAALHTLPFTFTRQFDMQTRVEKEPRVKTIHNWALESASKEYTREQYEGQAIQVQGHYHQLTSPKEMLQALYTTANDVHVFYAPSERTPKHLLVRVSGQAFQEHKEHTRPELDSFYSSGNKGFKQIYEEDFEGEDLEQNEQRQSRLSAYSKQYSPKNSYRHQLKVEAEAHCGDTTHKVMAEIKGACDSGLKHCKLFLEAQRSPLMWSMKTKIQTVAPEEISRSDDDMTKKQSSMVVDIRSDWGSERSNNQMNVRIEAAPTKTQYWRQTQQPQWSRFLNKITLVADYNLQAPTSHVVNRFYELAKAKAFWAVSVQERQSSNENVVRATMVIDPITKKHANFSVETPTEKVRAQGIELPIRVAPFTLSKRSSKVNSMGDLIQSVVNFSGAQCKVDERRIKTFDGILYRAALSSCWSVLAKDCSREEPRFVVMMKKAEESKNVKIVTPRSTIELISKQGQRPIVKINGEQETNEEELQQQGIELSYDQVYVRKSGIKVQFDGEEVQVKVGGQYKNLQCGLCGHYNNEEEDVFRLGNGQRSNSLKEFHKSYTLKNEECDNSQLNKHYEQNSNEFEIQRQSGSQRRQQQSAWFDDSEEESRRFDDQYDSDEEQTNQQERRQNRQNPVKRTKVIEYSHKICFSSEPVQTCPRGTIPSGDVETKSVHFACLDRNLSDARRFLRMVRQGKVVPSEELQKGAFSEEVEVPQKCRRQSTF